MCRPHLERGQMVKRLLGLVSTIVLVLPACGGDGGIGVTLSDFRVELEEGSASTGEVAFDVTNDAQQIHEFVIIKTDLPEDQLPTDESGDVSEGGEGVNVVDKIEDIEGGSSDSLTIDLEAGAYVLICNLPSHYLQGMHTAFTVS